MFFHNFPEIFDFFKHIFNKPVDCISTMMLLHWFTNFIIRAYNFVTITAI